jgi:hypothetical protein
MLWQIRERAEARAERGELRDAEKQFQIASRKANESGDARLAGMIEQNLGAELTSVAFAQTLSWFPYILTAAVVLFAYSTMISWSYYGERCWAYLFGDRASLSYKVLFLAFVFLGAIASAENVLEFGDLMILGMAFPNILGVILLSNKVKRHLDDYWHRYKAGEFEIRWRVAAGLDGIATQASLPEGLNVDPALLDGVLHALRGDRSAITVDRYHPLRRFFAF